jgi:hypothetical protein
MDPPQGSLFRGCVTTMQVFATSFEPKKRKEAIFYCIREVVATIFFNLEYSFQTLIANVRILFKLKPPLLY